jgi:DNA-binding transcriptional LysR family regulator
LDLNDIALFVQIVRAGSFAKAGRQLNIRPSTASRRVQQLERELATRLMHRSTRRLTLTEGGRAFFAECAAHIDALVQSAQHVIDGSATPSGKVRVAAPADFFSWFPSEQIGRFLAAHPRVRLEFELDDAPPDLLGQGIDVAFRSARTVEPGLIARQLGSRLTTLVASPRYLAARGTPRSPAELVAHDCITQPTRGGPPVLWRLEGPSGSVEIAVNGRFQANTALAQLNAAVAGLGIALLPATLSAALVRAGRLQQVLPELALEKIGYYAVFLSRRQIPRAVSAFVEFATTIFRQVEGIAPLAAKPPAAPGHGSPRRPRRV